MFTLRNLAFVGLLFLGLWPSLLGVPYASRLWSPIGVGSSSARARLVQPDQPPPPAQPVQPAILAPQGSEDAPRAKPPITTWPLRRLPEAELQEATDTLQADMAREVAGLSLPSPHAAQAVARRATTLMRAAGRTIEAPQLVIVVDRNPAVERLYLMLARPDGPDAWRALGSARVSTGQAGRKDYYITPVGVFAHTGAILDFRAMGTYNEHHVRGLGLAGMRVWDFGWQWALKGWHGNGEGGDIRLQMHATDPTLLEQRLGRPASEGCVRVSSTMNRFLDKHGVLDADYEQEAAQDARYRALLAQDRTPTPIAGRLLVVIDSSQPADAPPTAQSRPPNWPSPETAGTVTASAAPVP
jgi:hypothetical protein